MAKIREDGGQADRDKPAWVALAESSRYLKRPKKLGVYITEDAFRRLETAGLVEGLDFSAIVDALLRTDLVGYYAGVRRGKDAPAAETLPAA